MSVRLNIACGPNMFPSSKWINYDREDMNGYLKALKCLGSPDGMPDHQKRLYSYLKEEGTIDFRVRDIRDGFPMHGDKTVDAIYLGQMIEHINPIFEAPKLMTECRRMLRPGGIVKITTPDLDLLIAAYRRGDMGMFIAEQPDFYKDAVPSAQLAYLMYGSCGANCTWANYEGHMFLYTRESIAVLLTKAGFQPPFKFYNEGGMSMDWVMAEDAWDAGMSHSFAVEAMAK